MCAICAFFSAPFRVHVTSSASRTGVRGLWRWAPAAAFAAVPAATVLRVLMGREHSARRCPNQPGVIERRITVRKARSDQPPGYGLVPAAHTFEGVGIALNARHSARVSSRLTTA